MKLFELLNERIDPGFSVPKIIDPRVKQDKWLEILPQVTNVLKTECAPYLKELGELTPKTIMYRGVKQSWDPNQPVIHDYDFFSKDVRLDRRPKDTPLGSHDFLNSIIGIAGKYANRTNSIFCTGNESTAGNYGSMFLVFPRGDFHYTWNTRVADHTTKVSKMVEQAFGLNSVQAYLRYKDAYVAENAKRSEDIKKEIADAKYYLNLLQTKDPSEIHFNELKDKISFSILTKTQEGLEKFILFKENSLYTMNNPSTEDIKERVRDLLVYTSIEKAQQFGYDVKYDHKGLSQVIDSIKGDDGTLAEAIESMHEIMISCESAYYMSYNAYYLNKAEFFDLMKE